MKYLNYIFLLSLLLIGCQSKEEKKTESELILLKNDKAIKKFDAKFKRLDSLGSKIRDEINLQEKLDTNELKELISPTKYDPEKYQDVGK